MYERKKLIQNKIDDEISNYEYIELFFQSDIFTKTKINKKIELHTFFDKCKFFSNFYLFAFQKFTDIINDLQSIMTLPLIIKFQYTSIQMNVCRTMINMKWVYSTQVI